jgi:hypothetical protein
MRNPLKNPSTNIWYSKQVIGEDKLGKIMKEMAKEVNHSGCKMIILSHKLPYSEAGRAYLLGHTTQYRLLNSKSVHQIQFQICLYIIRSHMI